MQMTARARAAKAERRRLRALIREMERSLKRLERGGGSFGRCVQVSAIEPITSSVPSGPVMVGAPVGRRGMTLRRSRRFAIKVSIFIMKDYS
jgi:hypothetical protein